MNCLPPNTPVYMAAGKESIDATRYSWQKQNERDFRHFTAWEPFEIGEFRITLIWLTLRCRCYSLVEAEGSVSCTVGPQVSWPERILFENLLKHPIQE